MPLPEKTCVSCGKIFTLLPNKPGLAKTCPQCSAAPAEIDSIERKTRQKRRKTANELVADAERKLYRRRKMSDVIFGKTRKDKKI
jgi:hypothetical protein